MHIAASAELGNKCNLSKHRMTPYEKQALILSQKRRGRLPVKKRRERTLFVDNPPLNVSPKFAAKLIVGKALEDGCINVVVIRGRWKHEFKTADLCRELGIAGLGPGYTAADLKWRVPGTFDDETMIVFQVPRNFPATKGARSVSRDISPG